MTKAELIDILKTAPTNSDAEIFLYDKETGDYEEICDIRITNIELNKIDKDRKIPKGSILIS